ncbi:hypothetical protein [Bythopirellula polymerisocia]|nr:hypothetical protein [Bythopirellula polymerisocia]
MQRLNDFVPHPFVALIQQRLQVKYRDTDYGKRPLLGKQLQMKDLGK